MIANEMHHRFNLLYEGGKLFNRTFNERETSDFLTKAQIQVVLKKIAPWKNRSGLGMGANNIRFDELAGLITGTATIPRSNFIQGTAANGALPGPRRIVGSGTTNPSLTFSTPGVDSIVTGYAAAPAYNFGVFVPIPDECVYILEDHCTSILYTQAAIASTAYIPNVPIKRISHMEYQAGINDKYAQPYANLVWGMDWGAYTIPTFSKLTGSGVFTSSTKDFNGVPPINSTDDNPTYIKTLRALYLIPGDSYEVLDYSMTYVKLPAAIVVNLLSPASAVDSELADFMHEEIVQEAVALASASIMPEPNKYQVNETEVKDNE